MIQGGIRVKNGNKGSLHELPGLSVVTVVRNCDNYLERTILNVINQQDSDIEYIIIDGESTDGTLDIIRKYEDKIGYWISESDDGIYDAMNKGIALARGTWINFMNAGDEFYSEKVLKQFSGDLMTNNFDILYGDVVAHNPESETDIMIKAKDVKDIWRGMIFSHQSCFIRTDVIKLFLFDLRYKLASDYNQILSMILNNHKFHYLPITVSRVRIGGLSYSNNCTILEQIKIVHSCKPYSRKLLYFGMLYIMNLFSTLLGKNLTGYIRKIKWKIRSKHIR